jgi:hypothetical protein
LLNISTARQVDPTNANLFTYSASNHMLETWNAVTVESIAINANETWGTCDWTCGNNIFQITEMTQARGKLGTANAVMIIGRKKFLERWKSTIMSHQIMQLLTPEGQLAIKIHKKQFQWTNPLSNETINDGCSLLHQVLKLMCPDVQTNVYAKHAKIKNIKPVDYAFNIVKWHSAMESKQISIVTKVPGAYHESQYIMDYLDASLTVECQEFQGGDQHSLEKILSRQSRSMERLIHC